MLGRRDNSMSWGQVFHVKARLISRPYSSPGCAIMWSTLLGVTRKQSGKKPTVFCVVPLRILDTLYSGVQGGINLSISNFSLKVHIVPMNFDPPVLVDTSLALGILSSSSLWIVFSIVCLNEIALRMGLLVLELPFWKVLGVIKIETNILWRLRVFTETISQNNCLAW